MNPVAEGNLTGLAGDEEPAFRPASVAGREEQADDVENREGCTGIKGPAKPGGRNPLFFWHILTFSHNRDTRQPETASMAARNMGPPRSSAAGQQRP